MALQTFTAGQVLTAAQLTSLQANDYNQTVSAKTSSYTLVAADKGTRITMSSASATTITVNTSLFTAGDSLRIQNLNGGGVCTVTAGTATVTSAGSLAIPSWGGGQLYFTSASAAVWFPDAATATPGALTLITAQTIGSAVSSVTVSGAFSATYDYYKITISGGTGSVNDEQLGLKLGSTATGYYNGFVGASYAPDATGTYSGNSTNSGTSFNAVGRVMTDGLNLNMELNGPYLAKRTIVSGTMTSVNVGRIYSGYLGDTTSYTAFTITPASGTITGGTIRVYGYANS